jgi:hypothetical protein
MSTAAKIAPALGSGFLRWFVSVALAGAIIAAVSAALGGAAG